MLARARAVVVVGLNKARAQCATRERDASRRVARRRPARGRVDGADDATRGRRGTARDDGSRRGAGRDARETRDGR